MAWLVRCTFEASVAWPYLENHMLCCPANWVAEVQVRGGVRGSSSIEPGDSVLIALSGGESR